MSSIVTLDRSSEEQCFDLALQVSAMRDGLLLYTAPGAKSVTPRSRLNDMVKQAVLRLLDAAVAVSR